MPPRKPKIDIKRVSPQATAAPIEIEELPFAEPIEHDEQPTTTDRYWVECYQSRRSQAQQYSLYVYFDPPIEVPLLGKKRLIRGMTLDQLANFDKIGDRPIDLQLTDDMISHPVPNYVREDCESVLIQNLSVFSGYHVLEAMIRNRVRAVLKGVVPDRFFNTWKSDMSEAALSKITTEWDRLLQDLLSKQSPDLIDHPFYSWGCV